MIASLCIASKRDQTIALTFSTEVEVISWSGKRLELGGNASPNLLLALHALKPPYLLKKEPDSDLPARFSCIFGVF